MYIISYPLHQGNSGLVEEDVEAGDKAKTTSERCVKCDDLRLWRTVKGLLEVEVVFMIACYQQSI